MQIDEGAGSEANKQEVRFDNLYDLLFDGEGHPKTHEGLTKSVLISGQNLDFLDQNPTGSNVQFLDAIGNSKAVDVDKLKISKQFKLVNPIPKFQSVPANP